MKIVCEACQAKYSISDDKVRGKAFKIRCKKCSHIIVVRSADGSSSGQLPVQTADPASSSGLTTLGPASASDNSWHIVVEGEQVGPLSAADVKARLSRGEITGETFIWREGMSDWLKISVVPDFADGAAADEDSETPFPNQSPTAIYPPGTAEGAFAASAPAEQDVFAAPAVTSPKPSADLFASPVTVPEPATSSIPSFSFGSSAPAGEAVGRHSHGNGVGATAGLTGQRHENSVLFSLSNLEALAAPSAAANQSVRPGAPGGSSEGSGLIDIRSMAAMTLGTPSDTRPSNDLPAYGAPQFSPVMPVMLPIGPSSGPSKWTYVLVAVAALLALIVGIASYVIATRPVAAPPAPPAAAPVATAPVVPAPSASAPATAPVPAAPATPPVTPPPPVNEALPPRETSTKPAAPERPGKPGKKGHSAKPSRNTDSLPPPPVVAPPVAPPAPAHAEAADKPNVGKRDKLDDLLDGALGQKPKAAPRPREDDEPRKPPAGSASLPQLEKGDIVRAMMAVNPKVHECYNQFKVPGTAMVTIKVARGGRVSEATVTGKFAGTPTGGCVESAARSAKFPPTDAQSIQYPFQLR